MTSIRHAAPFLFAAALAGALPAQAQTEFTTGGIEARAFLARSSTIIYTAGYGSGLFRSTNSGAAFTRFGLPGNARYLTSLAGTTTTVVAGAEEGLFTSTDGTTFTQRLFEPVSAVAATSGGTVLAGVKGLGILRSTNHGVTFAAANNGGLAGRDVIALAEDPSNANVFYVSLKPDGAGNRGGVFKSTDGGQNWTATSAIGASNLRIQVFGLAVDSSGSAFAAVFQEADGQGGVYKLTGGGGAWAQQSNTFTSVSVHRDANTGTTIWGGHRVLGLKRSVGGAAFTDQFPNNGGSPSFFYTSINAVGTLPGSTNVLKAIKGAGVYLTTNANGTATTWNKVQFPGADRVLSATGIAGNATPMLLGLHAGGVWRSDTAGNASSTFNPPIVNAGQADFSYNNAGATAVSAFNSVWELTASTTTANLIYAATGNVGMHYGNDNPGVFRYNGAVWAGIAGSTGAVGAGAPAPFNLTSEPGTLPFGPFGPVITAVYGVTNIKGDDQTWFASMLGSPGLHRRVAGPTWAAMNTSVAGNATPQIRAVVTGSVAGGNNRVIALPFDDRPLYSTDFGTTFTQSNVAQGGFERLRFYAVAENPTNANNWVGATNKGVYVSNNSGQSWTRVAAGFARQSFSAVGFKPTGRAFIADSAGNRYCSSDGGNNWSSAGAALRAGVNAIRSFNSQLYYLTDGAGAQREDGSC